VKPTEKKELSGAKRTQYQEGKGIWRRGIRQSSYVKVLKSSLHLVLEISVIHVPYDRHASQKGKIDWGKLIKKIHFSPGCGHNEGVKGGDY